jgi:EAL domain-containing protein (putative c-di-GMP-specific phosphodiesterase class I)/ActR/RegA family two-component response regulator
MVLMDIPLLHKPYQRAEFAAIIRQVMESSHTELTNRSSPDPSETLMVNQNDDRIQMTANQKVLVIDDERDIGEYISAVAESLGIPCTATTDADVFLAALTPDTNLIFLDLMMPGIDGIELLRVLSQRGSKVRIVLISGSGKRIIETAVQLVRSLGLTVIGFLQKPFRLAELEIFLKTHATPASAPVASRPPLTIIADDELRRAIELDEFVLHYQPQIDLISGCITGMEALVRWQHPTRGLIYPDGFIAHAESLGLIDQLGWITFRHGLHDVGSFAGHNGMLPILSLNVSVTSLQDLKFPDKLLSLATQYGVLAENITIEITESGLLKELSKSLDVLTRLRLEQIRLSIDDFGTGYSMMQQLRNVPATELKIDKSFVQNIYSNDGDRVMVQKTIEIGRELGLRVVGEGVETQEQLDFLIANHCDAVQGYFFTRPLPTSKLLDWIKVYRAKQPATSSAVASHNR